MQRLGSLVLCFASALAVLLVINLGFRFVLSGVTSVATIIGAVIAWVLISGVAAGAASARWFARLSRPVGLVTLGLAALGLLAGWAAAAERQETMQVPTPSLPHPRLARGALLGAALVLGLTACQGGGTGPKGPASDRPGTVPPAASTPSARPLPPTVPTDLGQPLKTLRYDDGAGNRLSLDVFELRPGPSGSVQLWAHVTKDASAPGNTAIGGILTYAWNATETSTRVPDGFQLLDAANRRMHRPMTTSGGDAVCAPKLLDLGFKANEAYVTCLFDRPQSDRVSIEVVNFGRVPDAQVH